MKPINSTESPLEKCLTRVGLPLLTAMALGQAAGCTMADNDPELVRELVRATDRVSADIDAALKPAEAPGYNVDLTCVDENTSCLGGDGKMCIKTDPNEPDHVSAIYYKLGDGNIRAEAEIEGDQLMRYSFPQVDCTRGKVLAGLFSCRDRGSANTLFWKKVGDLDKIMDASGVAVLSQDFRDRIFSFIDQMEVRSPNFGRNCPADALMRMHDTARRFNGQR